MISENRNEWSFGYFFLKQEEIDKINENEKKLLQCKLLLDHHT